MKKRSAMWLGGLATVGLLAGATVASAGVADTPLPTFSGGVVGAAQAVYYSVGTIKNNQIETDFVCTNTTTTAQNIGLQVFDETGALRNTWSLGTNGEVLSVAPGVTITFTTGGTILFHEDVSLVLNLAGSGVSKLRNGSARIVSTSKSISCTAMLVDKLHQIVDPLTSIEASPTLANLPLIKLP